MAFLLSLLSWTWMPLLTARWDLDPLLSLSRGTALRPTLGFILQTEKEIDSLSRAPMYRELLRLGELGDWRERETDVRNPRRAEGGEDVSYNLFISPTISSVKFAKFSFTASHIKTNCCGTLHPSPFRLEEHNQRKHKQISYTEN